MTICETKNKLYRPREEYIQDCKEKVDTNTTGEKTRMS